MAKKIDELQEILRKKDEDMKRMEERYKHYVEKARTVSTPTPTPPTPPTPLPLVTLCSLAICVVVFCVDQVIKTLDPQQPPTSAPPDIQALKNQLSEKERKIKYLEVQSRAGTRGGREVRGGGDNLTSSSVHFTDA